MPQRRVPVELRILDGTYKPGEHGPRPDKSLSCAPKKPAGLDKKVSKKWDEYVMLLAPMLHESDGPQLAALCDLRVKWEDANADLAKMKWGAVGYAKRLAVVLTLLDRFNKIASLFGMTPVDRAKLRFEMSGPKRPKVDSDKPKVNLPPPKVGG
jgi:phage terminase small subunit